MLKNKTLRKYDISVFGKIQQRRATFVKYPEESMLWWFKRNGYELQIVEPIQAPSDYIERKKKALVNVDSIPDIARSDLQIGVRVTTAEVVKHIFTSSKQHEAALENLNVRKIIVKTLRPLLSPKQAKEVRTSSDIYETLTLLQESSPDFKDTIVEN